jgi:hypothetical protein
VITLVFEVYGAFCIFSLIAFLILASVAKLRPDLDEEELDFVELEKLKKLAHSERSDGPLSLEPPIIEEAFWSEPPRPVKQSKRQIPRRPVLIHLRKPRIT